MKDMSRTAWVTRSVVTACWFMRARVEIAWDPHLQADQMVVERLIIASPPLPPPSKQFLLVEFFLRGGDLNFVLLTS